mgnify:CR=1 FL=1
MKQNKEEEKAIDAVADYLRSIGWKPFVGQFTGIEQGNAKYNFRLIFNFTGTKRDKKNKF